MDFRDFMDLSGFRLILVLLGLMMIIGALVLFLGKLVGFVPDEFFGILGQSALRTIAGLAVAGCIVAAIGYGKN